MQTLRIMCYFFFFFVVQDTIARARIAEAFMNASMTAGLSDNLEDLAKLVDEEEDEEGIRTYIQNGGG